MKILKIMKTKKKKEYRPTVAIDFDGVIHAYREGWCGADVVDDEPVGYTIARSGITFTAIDWLESLVDSGKLDVCIFSSRNSQKGGIEAMKGFLLDNGMHSEVLAEIDFPKKKPSAHVLIDDRCLPFTGHFFTVDQILKFQPWRMKNES
jgi:hypothetical protein